MFIGSPCIGLLFSKIFILTNLFLSDFLDQFLHHDFDIFLFSIRRIEYSDLRNIAPEHYTHRITARLTDIKAVESPDDRGIFIQVLESVYRFALGSFAGGNYRKYLFFFRFFCNLVLLFYSGWSDCCLSN